MILQWAFVIIYSLTLSFYFLLGTNKTKTTIMTLAAALTSVVFFVLHGYIGDFSVIISIILFRIIVLVWQVIVKNGLKALYHTMALICIDISMMPLLKIKITWEYAIVTYLIIFCLITLTPFLEKRVNSIEWLYSCYAKKKYIPIFLPIIPFSTSIVLFFLMRGESIKSIVILSTMSLLFTVSVILLQEYILQTMQIGELNFAMDKWQTGAKEYMNTIRAQRHDFNIHLHAISGLIAGNDFEKCKEYIKKLVDEANDVNEIMPIYDAVIGFMIADMRKQARRKGTDVHYDIKYDMKNIVCSAYECNQILGNLIQNAIDAISTEEEKNYGILVSIIKRSGNAIVTVENKCQKNSEELERIFNLGYTTKKGHEGIGLAMVEKTLTRYSGKIYVKLEDDILRFIVYIPIRITEEG